MVKINQNPNARAGGGNCPASDCASYYISGSTSCFNVDGGNLLYCCPTGFTIDENSKSCVGGSGGGGSSGSSGSSDGFKGIINLSSQKLASCTAVKAYDANWTLITESVSALPTGTTVNFCAQGETLCS